MSVSSEAIMSVSTDRQGVPAPIPVLAIHKRDGRVVARFESYGEAARWAGVPDITVTSACRINSLSNGPYMFRREDSWSGRETFKPRAGNKPVVAMSEAELLWFPSSSIAAEGLGVSQDTIRYCLYQKTKVRGKYQVAYLTSTDDWPRLKALVEERRGGCGLLK